MRFRQINADRSDKFGPVGIPPFAFAAPNPSGGASNHAVRLRGVERWRVSGSIVPTQVADQARRGTDFNSVAIVRIVWVMDECYWYHQFLTVGVRAPW